MSNQQNIQVRSNDPLSEVTSWAVNMKTLAMLDGKTKGVIEGFKFSILLQKILRVGKGRLVKDSVVIDYYEHVDLDASYLPDGIYYVVAFYVYQVIKPVPVCEIKYVTSQEYNLHNAWYLFLGSIKVENGIIVQTSYSAIDNNNITVPYITGHNSLDGLQGGAHPDEFYHLTKFEHDNLGNINLPTSEEHNNLLGIQGGQPGEYYHLDNTFFHAWMSVLLDDEQSWHNSPIYINGGFINADILSTISSEDISLVVHNHDHSLLTNVQGTGQFHITADQLNKLRNGDFPYNAMHLEWHPLEDFSLLSHNHEHNSLNDIQGGNGVDEFYHLTKDALDLMIDLANGVGSIPNTDLLDGHDSSEFALANHNHNHNDMLGIQGGAPNEYYHLDESEYDYIRCVKAGNCKVPNSYKLDNYGADYFAPANHTHNHNDTTNIQGGSPNNYYHVNGDIKDGLDGASIPSAVNVILTFDSIPDLHHNDLTGIQGGSSSYKMHFSSDEYHVLTDGVDSDASDYHCHSNYYKKDEMPDLQPVDQTVPFTNDFDVNNNHVNNVGTPINSQDIIPKEYLDTVVINMPPHNDLNGLQGGDNNGRWHLAVSQYNCLVNAQAPFFCDIHHHDDIYYDKVLSDDYFVNLSGDTLNGDIDMHNFGLSQLFSCVIYTFTDINLNEHFCVDMNHWQTMDDGQVISKKCVDYIVCGHRYVILDKDLVDLESSECQSNYDIDISPRVEVTFDSSAIEADAWCSNYNSVADMSNVIAQPSANLYIGGDLGFDHVGHAQLLDGAYPGSCVDESVTEYALGVASDNNYTYTLVYNWQLHKYFLYRKTNNSGSTSTLFKEVSETAVRNAVYGAITFRENKLFIFVGIDHAIECYVYFVENDDLIFLDSVPRTSDYNNFDRVFFSYDAALTLDTCSVMYIWTDSHVARFQLDFDASTAHLVSFNIVPLVLPDLQGHICFAGGWRFDSNIPILLDVKYDNVSNSLFISGYYEVSRIFFNGMRFRRFPLNVHISLPTLPPDSLIPYLVCSNVGYNYITLFSSFSSDTCSAVRINLSIDYVGSRKVSHTYDIVSVNNVDFKILKDTYYVAKLK